jgi:transcriptional regulator with XRE-family HTH domain
MTFGERLAQLLKAQGPPQVQFAELLDVSQQVVIAERTATRADSTLSLLARPPGM